MAEVTSVDYLLAINGKSDTIWISILQTGMLWKEIVVGKVAAKKSEIPPRHGVVSVVCGLSYCLL